MSSGGLARASKNGRNPSVAKELRSVAAADDATTEEHTASSRTAAAGCFPVQFDEVALTTDEA